MKSSKWERGKLQMDKFSVIDYFMLCEIRDTLFLYEYAYRICRYKDEVEHAESYAELQGEEYPMEWVFHACGVEAWASFQITRYSWCYRRLVDYTMYYLSLCGILPLTDGLHLCKEIFLPDKEDYYMLAGYEDTAYESFCERYMTRLFHAAGWTITELDYEEYVETEVYHQLIVPVITDEETIGFLLDYDITGDEDGLYYLFTSEAEEYSYIELYYIFKRFFTEAAVGIVNRREVILFIPPITIIGNIVVESDWSQYCPISALDAWMCYMYKKLFGMPRLEMLYESKN